MKIKPIIIIVNINRSQSIFSKNYKYLQKPHTVCTRATAKVSLSNGSPCILIKKLTLCNNDIILNEINANREKSIICS